MVEHPVQHVTLPAQGLRPLGVQAPFDATGRHVCEVLGHRPRGEPLQGVGGGRHQRPVGDGLVPLAIFRSTPRHRAAWIRRTHPPPEGCGGGRGPCPPHPPARAGRRRRAARSLARFMIWRRAGTCLRVARHPAVPRTLPSSDHWARPTMSHPPGKVVVAHQAGRPAQLGEVLAGPQGTPEGRIAEQVQRVQVFLKGRHVGALLGRWPPPWRCPWPSAGRLALPAPPRQPDPPRHLAEVVGGEQGRVVLDQVGEAERAGGCLIRHRRSGWSAPRRSARGTWSGSRCRGLARAEQPGQCLLDQLLALGEGIPQARLDWSLASPRPCASSRHRPYRRCRTCP